MSAHGSSASVFEVIRSLWSSTSGDAIDAILPTDAGSLEHFYEAFRAFVSSAPRQRSGHIEAGATVAGEIISMGPDSRIEAGAVVHPSCRLILGPRSVIRAGTVLRDEVVVGPDSLIGTHCEVVRTVMLGPHTCLGHFIYLADSIVGAHVNVAGNVMVANTTVKPGTTIHLLHAGTKVDSRRTHLGALIGDRVRFGASTTVCPGCIILPGLMLPPSVTLHGTVDAARRRALMKQFSRTWAAPTGSGRAQVQADTRSSVRR